MDSCLLVILKLRVIVSFLGERSQYDWWPTSFFGDYSMRSLEFVAPKTAMLAQYHGAVEAARRRHDEHLSVGTHNLFRLPEEFEQDLHSLVQTTQGTAIIREFPKDKETTLSDLVKMASNSVGAVEGPVSLGSMSMFREPATAKSIACVYANAFPAHVKAYPYLVK